MWKAVSLTVLFAFAAFALPGCSDAVSRQSDPTPSNDGGDVGSREGDVTGDNANASDHATAGKDARPSDDTAAQSSDPKAAAMPDFSELTDAEWRKRLSDEEYYILRQKGTERPWVNKYDRHFEPGSYACAGCGQVLFESDTKFDSGCGWPAFYAAKAGDRVKLHNDFSFGMIRTEVVCARCDGHLGHVFDDAPQTPTGQRYCINSVALKFIPKKSDAAADKDTKTKETENE